ncbi:MBL fold metallo-hydrolase [Thermaerobacillus caldiproteolyticus]|uniref:Glyoxylase-like metal-dependent hydrolase (Beta-lactamase superfamily II) n=1 Tax=Thermaerobacillus caldiproteolyticus TaxID=247480 RepID=A0A7V9Z3F3_9BACL|nr:MBL fold metallo-hydrolase [Anoxybacillus caldiproteolyticus]MBA2873347.1 glyoxylase-like metal-dependent hydrolase (beta-lactamase superfamily II) [Anoxybacillus caldiproteolyticus]QPA29948.1 MBL fold metallo-hydrolase [Anoxybacillus caldiproteolyticus]
MENEDIYRFVVPTPFSVGNVNMYLIKGDSLTLVDAGVKTEEAWQSFKKQLHELGYEPSDIDQVIVTHHHPDHVGLLDYLPEGVPVIGHEKADRWIRQDPVFFDEHQRFFEQFFLECGVERAFLEEIPNWRRSLRYSCRRSLSGTVKEGDSLPGLTHWKVIETPGHAQSHIVFYRETDGLMLGGDHLLLHISPNPMLEPPFEGEAERPKPLLQYNASLLKMRNYEITRVMTGHGEDVQDVNSLIEKRLAKQRERAEHVLDMLKQEPLTPFQVCQRLFPTAYEQEFMLTMSETIGQLDYLEDVGAVIKQKIQNQYVYEAVEGSH